MKKIISFLVSCVLIAGQVVPALANNGTDGEEKNQEISQMTLQEISEKKAKVKVPDKVNEDISTFVQDKRDVWSVLSSNLDKDSYGGMYIEDGVLHIKTKQKDKVTNLISEINEYKTLKTESVFDKATKNIIIEDDCKYSLSDLEKAMDKVWKEKENNKINIVGVGTDDELNGLIIDAPDWNEEEKENISYISGIDMDHLTFEISKGNFEDLSESDDAMPGSLVYSENTGEHFSIGCGVYVERDTDDEGDGQYGWITAGHAFDDEYEDVYMDNYNFNEDDYYVGYAKYFNSAPQNGNQYADVSFINKARNSDVNFTLETYTGELVLNTGDAIRGEDVSLIGGTSGLVDGGRVISNNYTCDWNGDTYYKMIKTDIEPQGGDSGGPLVRVLDNGQYTILGILKGHESDDNWAVFTAWSSIENRLTYGSHDISLHVWLWP